MARGHGRKRRGGHGAEHENDERWLLTYADMITLLMALFMVLFSISSVNISKFIQVQESLRAAFSGDILPGGKAIAHPGATANSSQAPPSSIDAQAIVPLSTQIATNLENSSSGSSSAQSAASASAHGAAQGGARAAAQTAAQSAAQNSAAVNSAAAAGSNIAAASQEQSEFERIKRELEAYAHNHGFGQFVHISVESRGLVIKVLTDDLLFASGSATLDAQGDPLLSEIAVLLNVDEVHPVGVYGNTDDVPIQTGQFPSNWELSAARASTVVRFLAANGVAPDRLSATGYADMRPVASNETPGGRAQNRRVEVVLQRLY
jgi:chemotaxis protein MotB